MKWLQSEIATGFQRLVVLRLRNAPPEEALVATVGVWLDTLMHMPIEWEESLDRSRIARAFITLCQQCDSWPSIKQFIEILPARAPPPALPIPKTDSKVAKENIAKLKAMLRNKPIFKRI